jgi:hypothetical protein
VDPGSSSVDSGPYDEVQRQQHRARRTARVGDRVEEQPRRLRADLLVGDGHRGQGRLQLVEEGHVVEPDHADVSGAVDAPLGEHVVAAERDQVVARHDRRELGPLVQQRPQPGGACILAPVLARHHELRIVVQPEVPDRGAERACAGQSGGGGDRSGEVDDAAVAELDEVADGQLDAGRVVRRDRRDVDPLGAPVDHHHRHPLAVQLHQQRVAEHGGRDDEPLDLP